MGALYRVALRGQLGELRHHRSVYRDLLASPGVTFGEQIEHVLRGRARLTVEHLQALGVQIPGAASGYAERTVAAAIRAAFELWIESEAGDDADLELAAAEIEAQMPAWLP